MPAGQDVSLTFEDVEKIGRDTAALATEAEGARTLLANAKGDPSAFGQYGLAQSVYSQHQAVVRVFEDTLGSVTTDLDDFGNTIVQASRQHAQTDDTVLGTLNTVAATVTPQRLQDTFDQARNNQGHMLGAHQLNADELTDLQIDRPELSDAAMSQLGGGLSESAGPVDIAVDSGGAGVDAGFDGDSPQ